MHVYSLHFLVVTVPSLSLSLSRLQVLKQVYCTPCVSVHSLERDGLMSLYWYCSLYRSVWLDPVRAVNLVSRVGTGIPHNTAYSTGTYLICRPHTQNSQIEISTHQNQPTKKQFRRPLMKLKQGILYMYWHSKVQAKASKASTVGFS